MENDKTTELVTLHQGGLIITALNRQISLFPEMRASDIFEGSFLFGNLKIATLETLYNISS